MGGSFEMNSYSNFVPTTLRGQVIVHLRVAFKSRGLDRQVATAVLVGVLVGLLAQIIGGA